MCFSAEASFAVGAALIACGVPTMRMAAGLGQGYLPLAAFPVFFGLQQIAEGGVWLSLDTNPTPPALIFLFFAYWFWPVWVPLSAMLVETDGPRRRLFRGLALAGGLFGAVLFLPLAVNPAALEISLVRASIRYANPGMFDTDAAKTGARLAYAAIICIPLLATTRQPLRGFGILIAGSVVAGFLFASYAFTSIWCFLAALISACLFIVLRAMRTAAA